MKKYKAVIFDLYDTLAGSRRIFGATKNLENQIGKEALKLLIDGGNIDIEASTDAILKRFKKQVAISADQERLIREWIEWDDCQLFDDTIEALRYLKGKKYIIGLTKQYKTFSQSYHLTGQTMN